MNPVERVAIMSDIHGERRLLEQALTHCVRAHVSRVVLLGDLFDRHDQIESCLRCLDGWDISGVLGNHEREALREFAGEHPQAHLLDRLSDRMLLENALFVHDLLELNGAVSQGTWTPNLVFAGHTHVRHARDQHGPIDISLGHIQLRNDRRYLINPGAVIDGCFAIWDRARSVVLFERL
jgi:predicted phosphodiesterase